MPSIKHRQQLNSRLIATDLFISGFVLLINVSDSASVSVILQSHRQAAELTRPSLHQHHYNTYHSFSSSQTSFNK